MILICVLIGAVKHSYAKKTFQIQATIIYWRSAVVTKLLFIKDSRKWYSYGHTMGLHPTSKKQIFLEE